MKYIIHREPLLYLESTRCLTAIFSGSAYKSKQAFIERSANASTKVDPAPFYDDIIELLEKIAAKVDLSGDTVEFLFKELETIPPMAYAFWVYDRLEPQALTEMQRRAKAIAIGILPNDENYDIKPWEGDFASWVDTLQLEPVEKFALLRLYFQFDIYLGFIETRVAIAQAIIKEALPSYEQEIDSFLSHIELEIDQNGGAFLSQWLNIKFDDDELYHIYPSLDLSITLSNDEDTGEMTLFLGIRTVKMIETEKEYLFRGPRLNSFFKSLADSTKLAILLMLKETTLYGGEIAEALKLSGATISHHMNTLIQLQLVSVDKQGNRIYYSLNEHVMKNYVDELRNLLL